MSIRFEQITATSEYLFALDQYGRIWRTPAVYCPNTLGYGSTKWVLLSSPQETLTEKEMD